MVEKELFCSNIKNTKQIKNIDKKKNGGDVLNADSSVEKRECVVLGDMMELTVTNNFKHQI